MSKYYKYSNDRFEDELDDADSYGYEVKNIRRQQKKKVRKFKDYDQYSDGE